MGYTGTPSYAGTPRLHTHPRITLSRFTLQRTRAAASAATSAMAPRVRTSSSRRYNRSLGHNKVSVCRAKRPCNLIHTTHEGHVLCHAYSAYQVSGAQENARQWHCTLSMRGTCRATGALLSIHIGKSVGARVQRVTARLGPCRWVRATRVFSVSSTLHIRVSVGSASWHPPTIWFAGASTGIDNPGHRKTHIHLASWYSPPVSWVSRQVLQRPAAGVEHLLHRRQHGRLRHVATRRCGTWRRVSTARDNASVRHVATWHTAGAKHKSGSGRHLSSAS